MGSPSNALGRLRLRGRRCAEDARTRAAAVPRRHGGATVSDSSEAGCQAGGPVVVRAVPTALRCRTSLGLPPNAVTASRARTGCSNPAESSGDLTGGSPSLISSSEARDRMPGANGWTGRSCVIGCWPPMPSCAMSASGAAVGAAATWTGTGERAKGARTRRAANHPESRGCSLSQRCARAPTGTSVVSRARPEAAHRGASRQQQRMVPPKRVVKSP
jgi:hypothetical protein